MRGQIDLVLVDEFQDTSPIQLAIFLRLAELAVESVWVGDPKQAIFGFRGTDPKLMDAAIGTTSELTDPELVQQAVNAMGKSERIETLSISYRSRPELVRLTSDIFAPAFASQGMPEERTRLAPHRDEEPTGLGPVVEVWPLVPDRNNNETRAASVAEGVAQLLERAPQVRDGHSATRTARAGDIAVLCRTNAQCQQVADALAAVGIAAVVPPCGCSTLPRRVWFTRASAFGSTRDSLVAAEVARLLSYADRGDAFVARALDRPGPDAFADEPAVVAVLAAREAARDAPVLDLLELVMDAIAVREHAAAWGNATQRLANLDALRGHAEAYVAEAQANRHAPTLAGLLAYIDDLVDEVVGTRAARTRRPSGLRPRGDGVNLAPRQGARVADHHSLRSGEGARPGLLRRAGRERPGDVSDRRSPRRTVDSLLAQSVHHRKPTRPGEEQVRIEPGVRRYC